MLGAIIELASGKTYEAFLQENIFAPLKMVDSGYDHNNGGLAVGYRDQTNLANFVDMSIPYAAGGLYSTVEDLYRWDQALYTDKLIPKNLRDQMFTAFALVPDSGGFGYGYGWGIGKEGGHSVVSHAGGINGFTAAIVRYPNDKVVVIVLGNREDVDASKICVQLAKMVFGVK